MWNRYRSNYGSLLSELRVWRSRLEIQWRRIKIWNQRNNHRGKTRIMKVSLSRLLGTKDTRFSSRKVAANNLLYLNIYFADYPLKEYPEISWNNVKQLDCIRRSCGIHSSSTRIYQSTTVPHYYIPMCFPRISQTIHTAHRRHSPNRYFLWHFINANNNLRNVIYVQSLKIIWRMKRWDDTLKFLMICHNNRHVHHWKS